MKVNLIFYISLGKKSLESTNSILTKDFLKKTCRKLEKFTRNVDSTRKKATFTLGLRLISHQNWKLRKGNQRVINNTVNRLLLKNLSKKMEMVKKE